MPRRDWWGYLAWENGKEPMDTGTRHTMLSDGVGYPDQQKTGHLGDLTGGNGHLECQTGIGKARVLSLVPAS